MRLFSCDSCGNLLFFENSSCLRCHAEVGFDPASRALRLITEPDLVRCRLGAPSCNWLVAANDPEPRCGSCRLTTLHPPAGDVNETAWDVLEKAKRRLLHTLGGLELPTAEMRFEFPATGLTGHGNGVITVVLSEADDAERVRRQHELGEPLRTLIGHFRHESGHYFQPKLIASPAEEERFRACFGDERQDYQQALTRHYQQGAPAQWSDEFVSAYASCHPHEDWAETWAHYLHMHDAIEIASAYGLSLTPRTDSSTPPVTTMRLRHRPPTDFVQLMNAWIPLTWFANSLNRSLGHPDWYPFAPAPAVIRKLRFVHTAIEEARASTQPQSGASG